MRQFLTEVPSESRPDRKHVISLVGELVCSCEDSSYRGRDCKHIRRYVSSLASQVIIQVSRDTRGRFAPLNNRG